MDTITSSPADLQQQDELRRQAMPAREPTQAPASDPTNDLFRAVHSLGTRVSALENTSAKMDLYIARLHVWAERFGFQLPPR